MTTAPMVAEPSRAWERQKRVPPHIQILIGFVIGTGGGLAASLLPSDTPWVAFLTEHVTHPIGTLFLRFLFILALPLVFSAVISGIAGLRDLATLRRVGVRALLYMLATSALAALVGLAMVNLFRPGDGFDEAAARQLLAAAKGTSSIVATGTPSSIGFSAIIDMIPDNIVGAASRGNFLSVIFFAFLLGIGLVLVRTEATRQLMSTIEGLFQVSMRLIGLVIRFAPIAVACFMFDLTVMFGWPLLAHLGAYVGVVLMALALHMGIVLPAIVWIGGGRNPITFFRSVQSAAFIAFSTASSQATLPTSLRVAEEGLRLPPEIARFVLGLGTSVNQNGAAIYEAVTVIFLAQVLGVQLGFAEQLSVFAVCLLGGIGTAGVPAGSLPLVAMTLGMIGIPPEAIGLVIGVDRLLDMSRTMLNVLGDLAIAVAVAR